MKGKETYLYHQIHPLKLATDWIAGFSSLYWLWNHELVTALIVMLVPPVLASFFVMRFVDLTPQKNSALGRYILKYMTRSTEAIRGFGMFVMAVGAWQHLPVVIVGGLAIILLAWFRGKLSIAL